MVVGLCGLLLMASCAAIGQGNNSTEEPKYNPGTVVEFLATITDVQEAPQGGPLSGLHLTLKTGSDSVRAYIGPTAFVKGFEVTFAKADRIQLTGSKVKWGNAPIVLAREIRKEGTTVYLRDQQGAPYWPTS